MEKKVYVLSAGESGPNGCGCLCVGVYSTMKKAQKAMRQTAINVMSNNLLYDSEDPEKAGGLVYDNEDIELYDVRCFHDSEAYELYPTYDPTDLYYARIEAKEVL